MHQFISFVIISLCLLAIPSQGLAEEQVHYAEQPAVVEAEVGPDSIASSDYITKALYRSWRHNYRSSFVRPAPSSNPMVRGQVDSLLAVVSSQPHDYVGMRYLYDMRLPLISSGSVPMTETLTIGEEVLLQDSLTRRPESCICYRESLFDRQNAYERQRHNVRFNYASVDPRRFRYARRHFDVPTANSKVLDTESSLQNTRIIDDMSLDFSDATLEDFGHQLVIKADKWHWKGDHTLQMQQTALSDHWYKGGDNNMSVSGDQKISISRYDENKKTTFEMVLDLKLSAFYTTADTVHQLKVSDNQFTWDVKYGYKAWKWWYYSTQLYAKTPVFDYYASNSRVTKSSFLSPLEVNLSLGMDFKYTSPKKNFNYSLLLAPLSYNMKYVKDHRVNETSYGLEKGDKTLHEFGATLTNKFDWKMGPNATWSSRLYCFTSYKKVLVEFENTLTFNLSRLFSARIYLYPRFDDSSDRDVQYKEMFTFGFNYAW